MEEKIIKIDENNFGKRLDIFLQEAFSSYTRSYFKNLIDNGLVTVNAKTEKSGYKLRKDDVIKITIKEPEKISTEAEDVPFDIVYEDNDLVVVNKPQGLVVHPCSSTKHGTLVNGLIYRIKNLSGINGVLRPGIVHRLDKETSGLLVVAKNDKAHVSLSKQIKDKTCKRNYLALLEGNLKDDSGEIITKIGRDKKDRKKMAVLNEGREAITFFRVLERFKNACFVEFSLKTGRTHQIRVHAKYLGHPIIGDKVYGKEVKGLEGQLLHAYKLTFVHPTTLKEMTFEAPLPEYFLNYLDKLRGMKWYFLLGMEELITMTTFWCVVVMLMFLLMKQENNKPRWLLIC